MIKLFLMGLVSFGAFSFLRGAGGNDLEISVEEAHKKYSEDVMLLDVRTKQEWNECHVPNAVLIPLDELQNRLSEVPQDVEVVVMCRSGARSMTATRMLHAKGYKKTLSMKGGINAWFGKNFELTCTK